MNEDFLQYVWKFSHFDMKNLKTTDGQTVEVLSVGTQNTDAGPDFFDARIRIGDTLWAGNVEIHINSSDWKKHKHHTDKAYDNVILAVVEKDDAPQKQTTGKIVPTICLPVLQKIRENYLALKSGELWIPCENQVSAIDRFFVDYWLNRLMIERLEQKAQQIEERLLQNKNNWEETFYQYLFRNLGSRLNAEPFEMLARSLPMVVLGKHKNNRHQIEALLFGQAGMLDADYEDEYFQNLKAEYEFLKHKFGLLPIDGHLWKFMRLRPANFPTVRIAQIASLIYKASGLFAKTINASSSEVIKELYRAETTTYWDTHYVFGKISKKRKKNIGNTMLDTLIINTFAPFMFVYGESIGKEEMKDKAINTLEKTAAENNSIIKNWQRIGIPAQNAAQTQALLQLKNNYCTAQRCLDCSLGNRIIIRNRL